MTMDMGQKLEDFTLYGLCGYTTGSDESQKSNCEIVISDFESRMRKFEIPVLNFESGKRNILFIFSEGRNRKGWLPRAKLRPLVEIELARPIRGQDFRASINSTLPHSEPNPTNILVSPVNIDAIEVHPALVYK